MIENMSFCASCSRSKARGIGREMGESGSKKNPNFFMQDNEWMFVPCSMLDDNVFYE